MSYDEKENTNEAKKIIDLYYLKIDYLDRSTEAGCFESQGEVNALIIF